MTDGAEPEVLRLGRQVRALRERRGLSLRALAERIEVTASFLSQLERGLCSPSLATLRQLAVHLEVPVFQLLVEFDIDRAVVRANERVTLTPPDVPVTYQLLTSVSARNIELIIIRIHEPRVNIVRRLPENSEECMHVISGTMIIECGGERHTLGAGDSVTFSSSTLSHLSSVGAEELVVINAVSPPAL